MQREGRPARSTSGAVFVADLAAKKSSPVVLPATESILGFDDQYLYVLDGQTFSRAPLSSLGG